MICTDGRVQSTVTVAVVGQSVAMLPSLTDRTVSVVGNETVLNLATPPEVMVVPSVVVVALFVPFKIAVVPFGAAIETITLY
jgi:hypothetical protein